jgi:hypothetical protein
VPRRFGYIIVALAAVLGAGTLLLPLPEQVEVQREEAAPAAKSPRPPTTPAVPSRPAKKATAPPPPPPAAKAPAAAPPPFPMQDTTKTRTLVQPSQPKE